MIHCCTAMQLCMLLFVQVLNCVTLYPPVQDKVAGIRDRLYGFMQFGPKDNSMAYDICFGTIGYSLVLSRAFQEVHINV